jgi:hypothetical protein
MLNQPASLSHPRSSDGNSPLDQWFLWAACVHVCIKAVTLLRTLIGLLYSQFQSKYSILLLGAQKFNVCYESFSKICATSLLHVPKANPTATQKTSWLVYLHPNIGMDSRVSCLFQQVRRSENKISWIKALSYSELLLRFYAANFASDAPTGRSHVHTHLDWSDLPNRWIYMLYGDSATVYSMMPSYQFILGVQSAGWLDTDFAVGYFLWNRCVTCQ